MLIHACLPLSLVCVGVTGLIVGHPFDTIKVKLILQCVFYVMILLLWYLVAMVSTPSRPDSRLMVWMVRCSTAALSTASSTWSRMKG